MREAAHVTSLDARERASHCRPFPVHGGGGRRSAPRAPALAPEEPLLEVVRRQRRRRPRLRHGAAAGYPAGRAA